MSDVDGFELSVKPMFRPEDRDAMLSVFDLWEFADVRDNATAILERLEAGDMPCDGPWPQERVAVFSDWIASGMAP